MSNPAGPWSATTGPGRSLPSPDDDWLTRTVSRVPMAARLVGLLVFLPAAFYVKSADERAGGAPTWANVVVLVGVAFAAFFQVAEGVVAWKRPYRPPFDVFAWGRLLFVVAVLLGFGAWGVLDGDPKTPAWIGATMFGVGAAAVALMVVYLRKPVSDTGGPPPPSPYLPPPAR